ncbi:hypothetical protein LOD99_16040 [Oopsacas minuta]|uniref:RING-type domain-containing protein n=1 Tax=Oopsacas minuta TaxID=111878 RepID=A0AAV7K663_9METZ|nr:hypothetical protein LOD99_16040 [Oopsacas minuta]
MAEPSNENIPSVFIQMVDWKGGYSPELFTDDVTQFICPACSGVLSNPILLKKCGHIYCDSCLRHLRLKHSFCLLCNTKISPKDCEGEQQIQKIIEEIVISCPFMVTKECKWNDSVVKLSQHLSSIHNVK